MGLPVFLCPFTPFRSNDRYISPGLTFGQRQQSDGNAQASATQTDQVGALCLELQPLSGLDQVQRSTLKKEEHDQQGKETHPSTLWHHFYRRSVHFFMFSAGF